MAQSVSTVPNGSGEIVGSFCMWDRLTSRISDLCTLDSTLVIIIFEMTEHKQS